jgi:hypothetical protein
MHAQGFRYAPAVPAARFVGWLRCGPPWLDDRSRLADDLHDDLPDGLNDDLADQEAR